MQDKEEVDLVADMQLSHSSANTSLFIQTEIIKNAARADFTVYP